MKTNKKLYSVTLASVALILFLILVPSAVSAAPITITETQITNGGNASNADIYSNTIVWQDTRNGGNPDIYTYDISTKKETRITKSGSAVNPAIYGNLIVWSDGRNKNEGDIYIYDLSSKKETRITKSGYSNYPDIYGNNLVYQRSNEYQDSGIFLYNFSTKKVTQIAADNYSSNEEDFLEITNTNPVIYGNNLAWISYMYGGSYDYFPTSQNTLRVYDITTNRTIDIDSDADIESYLDSHDIFNNKTVWIKDYNFYQEGSVIFMYDFSTKKYTQITTSGSASKRYSNLRLYNNRIVFQEDEHSTNICMFDLSTKNETQITTSGYAYNPRIYGDRIVWQDSRNGDYDIYLGTLIYPLDANFSASPTSGKASLTVKFSDSSTGSPTSWYWNFGDKYVSKVKNPVHKYTKAGKYTISLTVKNAAGNSTVTKNNYITVKTAPVKPVAAFSASPTSGNVPLKVQFSDKSTGSPTSWKWSFGDGKTSTAKNPAYTYTKAGKYTVSLTVKNAAGTNTKTIKDYITVKTAPVKPVAAFSASPTSGYAPLKVTFTDKSANSPTSWKWTFGDGKTSTSRSPAYTYSKAGKYTVSLTVKNAAGSSSKTIKNYIVVNTLKAPIAAFYASPRSGKAPLNVQFTDKSTNSPTSWKWSFGDGTYSTAKNPVHKYSKAGTYTVSLTVKNAKGSNTKTISGYIVSKK